MIATAEKGEWERIDEFALELLPALELARSPKSLNPAMTVKREQVEQILKLLNSAIKHCSTRKDQIAPLIKAFTAIQNASNKP